MSAGNRDGEEEATNASKRYKMTCAEFLRVCVPNQSVEDMTMAKREEQVVQAPPSATVPWATRSSIRCRRLLGFGANSEPFRDCRLASVKRDAVGAAMGCVRDT